MAEEQSSHRVSGEQNGSKGRYGQLITAMAFFAALMFAGMTLLVCADVLLRNLGITTITWAVEVTEYMLMVSAFLASPWLVYTNDHIRVDILVRGLSGAGQRRAEVLGNVICLCISLVLAYESIGSMLDTQQQGGMVFKVLVFPEWWLGLPMVICFVMLSLEFIRRLTRAVLGKEGG